MLATPVELALFAHLVTQPEVDLDLGEAALLIASGEYPSLDVPHYLGMLDDLGQKVRSRVQQQGRTLRGIEVVLEVLYGEEGFRGNSAEYYDPRNSYLNETLDRKTGIPITLALVVTEVAQRAAVSASGVSFPGHFLVRADGDGPPLFVDPFEGRVLCESDLRAIYQRVTGAATDPSPRLLGPASKRQILVRMLNNLRGIYASRGDTERLRNVLERMEILSPTDEIRRQLLALGGTRLWPSSPRPQFAN